MRETLQEYCLQYGREELLQQWHPTKNGKSRPDQYLPGSHTSVWWKCCDGHEWKAVVYSRTGAQKCGCPEYAGKAPRIYK